MDPTPSRNPEVSQAKSFSGARVLVAIVIGSVLGAAVAFFMTVLIKNSPAEIPDQRTRLFVIMIIASGGLAGCSIESMRQLQEETTDDVYRRYNPHRGRRG